MVESNYEAYEAEDRLIFKTFKEMQAVVDKAVAHSFWVGYGVGFAACLLLSVAAYFTVLS